MFGQTFEFFDLFRVAFLVVLELFLSADNAIILATIVRSLPLSHRQKALWIGLGSAFVFRAIGVLAASLLMTFSWIQLLGACYLLYLSIRHVCNPSHKAIFSETTRSFWKAVLLIEFIDLAFAVDSILAAIAFISAIPSSPLTINPKLWIVYIGIILGLIAIRFAAKLFSNLIDRFPRLEITAYLMIGWIGLKLGINALTKLLDLSPSLLPLFEPCFWGVLILLFCTGFIKKKHG